MSGSRKMANEAWNLAPPDDVEVVDERLDRVEESHWRLVDEGTGKKRTGDRNETVSGLFVSSGTHTMLKWFSSELTRQKKLLKMKSFVRGTGMKVGEKSKASRITNVFSASRRSFRMYWKCCNTLTLLESFILSGSSFQIFETRIVKEVPPNFQIRSFNL